MTRYSTITLGALTTTLSVKSWHWTGVTFTTLKEVFFTYVINTNRAAVCWAEHGVKSSSSAFSFRFDSSGAKLGADPSQFLSGFLADPSGRLLNPCLAEHVKAELELELALTPTFCLPCQCVSNHGSLCNSARGSLVFIPSPDAL